MQREKTKMLPKTDFCSLYFTDKRNFLSRLGTDFLFKLNDYIKGGVKIHMKCGKNEKRIFSKLNDMKFIKNYIFLLSCRD